ncbi:MAG: cyanophycin synthetase [Herpetosiphonaceae bacterium]|nr:cyanophycin synthetase [Herpetosiphonaceae bacterium]
MRLSAVRIYRGPNIYGLGPVIRWTLDLEALEEYPTTKLGDFVDRLLLLIPTLQEHGCSYGEPGGFVRRLREGTWLGHVAEHLALEIQCLAGTPVTYGKTRSTGSQAGEYYVIYSYREERVGLAAGRLALQLIQQLLPPQLQALSGLNELADRGELPPGGEPFDYHRELEAVIRIAEKMALGPSTQSLVDEARRRGIPAIRLDDQSLVQLGYGKYQQRIRAAVTGRTSNIAVETASDKELTNRLLHDVGLPVPRNVLVRSPDEAVAAAERLGYPVVTKPLDVSHGRGVSIGLLDAAQVRWGFEVASEYRSSVLVETFLPGRDHRVLVINDRVVAVAERVPAHVVGDGKNTIQELIDITNRDPRRGIGHEKVLTRITVEEQAERLLDQSGYSLHTVLPAGEIFYLRATANISTGGTAIDRTNDIHYDNIEIARRAARVIGLDVCGIDMITPDISQPLRDTGGGIVEVNAGPGFRMHLQPSEGTPRNVAKPVIEMLFPEGSQSRIPMIGITGTNGKTTTARMVAHILKLSGLRVGLTTTDGIYIDGELLMRGDLTGPWSARMVLKDPTIEAAVLETARGGILREGLGYDRLDVGAVLNVREDHLGLAGINTLAELANVKGLVVEVVGRHGYSVLNADDPHCVALAERAGGKPVYFSLHGGDDGPDQLKQHIAKGGIAVVLQRGVKGDMIAIYHDEQYIPLLWTHLIPATFEGKALANVANALAATAISYAHGTPVETIRQGLRTFSTSFYQTPGRLNVFDEHPFRVLMDYGHNPAAFELMADLLRKLSPGYSRIIGVLAGPGDRRDEDLLRLGNMAAGMFDHLIIRQDTSLRGRPDGQTAQLIKGGALAGGMSEEQITTILPELEAVHYALQHAVKGELLVVFADQVTAVWKEIIYFKP